MMEEKGQACVKSDAQIQIPFEAQYPLKEKEGKEEMEEESESDKEEDIAESSDSERQTETENERERTKREGKNEMKEEEMSGRERLKRHRGEVAGKVWIPERWGQEDMLKDWIDCAAFDAPLVPSRIITARASLVQQAAAATSPNAATFRIENRC